MGTLMFRLYNSHYWDVIFSELHGAQDACVELHTHVSHLNVSCSNLKFWRLRKKVAPGKSFI